MPSLFPPTVTLPPTEPPRAAPPRIFRGLFAVSTFTVLSRILGLIRDRGMAGLFGLSPVMDAFTFAFRVPNLARRMFGEGALATAFTPVLARELEATDRRSAWALTSAVFTLLSVFLSALVLLVELGLWLFSSFAEISAETQLLVGLLAILMPYVVLVCVASQLGAVLNALGHFAWPALVPAVLNLCWIGYIWGGAQWFTTPASQAQALAACILLTGALQIAVQWPALHRHGYRFTLNWREAWPRVTEIVQVMLPVVLGLSITQINTFTDSLIAWGFTRPLAASEVFMRLPGNPAYPLQPGAVTALYYGERMYQFPLGVFGVALGTVLFPLLARHAARGELDRLRDDLSLGLRLVIVIGTPASAALVFLARPIARLMFEYGEFHAQDTLRTAAIIAAYGSGVWAYCSVLILQRGFYALGDRMTPLRIGLAAVGINVIGNLCMIWWFAEMGLAITTACCAAFLAVPSSASPRMRSNTNAANGLSNIASRIQIAGRRCNDTAAVPTKAQRRSQTTKRKPSFSIGAKTKVR